MGASRSVWDEVLKTALYGFCVRADQDGIDSLPEFGRIPVIAWSSYGELSNSGVKWLTRNVVPSAEIARCFRALKQDEIAGAIDRVGVAISLHGSANTLDGIDWELFGSDEDSIYRVGFDGVFASILAYWDAIGDTSWMPDARS